MKDSEKMQLVIDLMTEAKNLVIQFESVKPKYSEKSMQDLEAQIMDAKAKIKQAEFKMELMKKGLI